MPSHSSSQSSVILRSSDTKVWTCVMATGVCKTLSIKHFESSVKYFTKNSLVSTRCRPWIENSFLKRSFSHLSKWRFLHRHHHPPLRLLLPRPPLLPLLRGYFETSKFREVLGKKKKNRFTIFSNLKIWFRLIELGRHLLEVDVLMSAIRLAPPAEVPTTAGKMIRFCETWAMRHKSSETLFLTYDSGWFSLEKSCGMMDCQGLVGVLGNSSSSID